MWIDTGFVKDYINILKGTKPGNLPKYVSPRPRARNFA